MAVSPEQIEEFIEKVEREIQENDAKLAKVQEYLDSQNFQASAETTEEAKKMLAEVEKKAEYESNQRVAQMRDENSVHSSAPRRTRGLAI